MWPSLEGGASGTAGQTAADGAVGPALSPSGLVLEGSSGVDPLEQGLADLWGDLGHLFHGLRGWRAGAQCGHSWNCPSCQPPCGFGSQAALLWWHHTHGAVSLIKILTWHAADPRGEGCGGRLPGLGF